MGRCSQALQSYQHYRVAGRGGPGSLRGERVTGGGRGSGRLSAALLAGRPRSCAVGLGSCLKPAMGDNWTRRTRGQEERQGMRMRMRMRMM